MIAALYAVMQSRASVSVGVMPALSGLTTIVCYRMPYASAEGRWSMQVVPDGAVTVDPNPVNALFQLQTQIAAKDVQLKSKQTRMVHILVGTEFAIASIKG